MIRDGHCVEDWTTSRGRITNRGPRLRLADPAGRNTGLTRFFLNVRDRLVMRRDLFADAFELGERFLAIDPDLVPLVRIVTGRKISRQPIDATLKGIRKNLGAAERITFRRHPLLPVGFVLLGLLAGSGRWSGRFVRGGGRFRGS